MSWIPFVPQIIASVNHYVVEPLHPLIESLADAGAYSPVNPVAPMTASQNGQWDTTDFATHYFFGKGRPVNLEQVGLLDDFQDSSSGVKIQTDWEASVQNQVTEKVQQMRAQPAAENADPNVTIEFKIEDWYTYKMSNSMADPLYSLGGGGLTSRAACKITLNRDTGQAQWSADLSYEGHDPFHDPFSNGKEIPFSTPYNIDFQWNKQIGGTIT